MELPKTMIGVVGVTGAGKSSTINALLDAQIVPTSGVNACTAVVTEISYHNKPMIEADIDFISDIEWQNDVADLKSELEGQTLKPGETPNLPNSNVPWAKVRAVYPLLELSQVPHHSVDDIIESRPDVRRMLGTTRRLSAANVEEFALQLSQYVSSMPHARPSVMKSRSKRRGRNKRKGKGKAATPDQAVPATPLEALPHRELESISNPRGTVKQERRVEDLPDEQDAPDIPDTVTSEGAVWPLVGKVSIRCDAPVLSTGAILVDLPGMMDDNAARNSIASAYLGKCQQIWIIAKIQRAVNDQLAKRLLGDHLNRQIKMDSNLSDQTITFIATHTDDVSPTEIARSLFLHEDLSYQALKDRLFTCQSQLQDLEDELDEHTTEQSDAHKAIKDGQNTLAMLRQQLTGSVADKDDGADPDGSVGCKRPQDDQQLQSHKRMKLVKGDEPDGEIRLLPDSPGSSATLTQGGNRIDLAEKIEAIERDLLMKKKALPGIEACIAKDKMDILTHRAPELEAQRALNAYASMKRSEYARGEMKKAFRLGLDELKGHSDRDTSSVDLPVFCCSARDYVRLTGQISGDGKSSCFSDVEETEIPALQSWCIKVTEPARRATAEHYLLELKALAETIRDHVNAVGRTIKPGHAALKLKWESAEDVTDVDNVNGDGSEVDELKEEVGISRILKRSFVSAVADSADDLKEKLTGDLKDICISSAKEASSEAPEFVTKLPGGMRWNTYRALLRRHGSWNRNINEEMADPMLQGIAYLWAETFKEGRFEAVGDRIDAAARALFQDLEESAAPGVRDGVVRRVQIASTNILRRARFAVRAADVMLTTQQRNASRSLVPYIQKGLIEGYDRSMHDRGSGRGSALREQAIFKQYVEDKHATLFDDAAGMLVDQLVEAADTVRKNLMRQVVEFANDIEVEISTLWASVREDKSQIRARMATTGAVGEITRQVQFWQDAQARPPVSPVGMDMETT